MASISLPSSINLTTAGDSVPQAGVGQLYIDALDNKAYRYIFNNHASTALSTGLACFWDGATGKEKGFVTINGVANSAGPAGMPMGAVAAQKYGWIQVRGKNANCEVENATVTAANCASVQTNGKYRLSVAALPISAINDGADQTVGTAKTLRLTFE